MIEDYLDPYYLSIYLQISIITIMVSLVLSRIDWAGCDGRTLLKYLIAALSFGEGNKYKLFLWVYWWMDSNILMDFLMAGGVPDRIVFPLHIYYVKLKYAFIVTDQPNESWGCQSN